MTRTDAPATAPTPLLDEPVRRAVVEELASTPLVESSRILVAVSGGAVTLAGEVDTGAEKLAAEQVAQRVQGVHDIVQEITVDSSTTDLEDADIARFAVQALDEAVDVPPGSVRVRVHDRVVTLTGTVPWHYQRASAGRSVRHLRGVRDVVDQIAIKSAVSTARLSAAISRALLRRAVHGAGHCIVTADADGAVTLDGAVASWAERDEVEQIARAAPGVREIHDRLVVRG